MERSAELTVKENLETLPIGALLLANQLILPQDLEFALDHQKYSSQPLEEILVNIGAIGREDLENVLTQRTK